MTLIIILVAIGLLLLCTEVFLLPGITVAGIGAFLTCGAGIWRAFALYGAAGGFITLGIVFVLSVLLLALGLRPDTWRKLSLKENIDGASQASPMSDSISCGDRGTTVTRLAPSGKAEISGKIYEARSIDSYIDQRRPVEVVGFDDFSVVVRQITDDRPAAKEEPQEAGTR